MKLEKLKDLQIDNFIKLKVSEISKIYGEGRHDMSSIRNGGIIATDSADLTCRHGNGWLYYEGLPGDGHAGDWTNGKWSDNVEREFTGDFWV